MAAPERWMVSNPSADVDPQEGDGGNERTRTQPTVPSRSLITPLLRERLQKLRVHSEQGSAFTDLGSRFGLFGGSTFWTGLAAHHVTPGYGSALTRYVVTFAGDVVTTSGTLEDSSPTSVAADEPLIAAVARATDEQKERIWRVLGAIDVEVVKPVIEPNPQPVSSDWLEEALSARARPTPISLEDWYENEST